MQTGTYSKWQEVAHLQYRSIYHGKRKNTSGHRRILLECCAGKCWKTGPWVLMLELNLKVRKSKHLEKKKVWDKTIRGDRYEQVKRWGKLLKQDLDEGIIRQFEA